jgi:hypothetical protein
MAAVFASLSNNPSFWTFSTLPGFIVTAKGQIVVPVPVWGDSAKRSWLNSLKPFLHSLRPTISFYSEICILALDSQGAATDAQQEEAVHAVQGLATSFGGATGRQLRNVTTAMLSGAAI